MNIALKNRPRTTGACLGRFTCIAVSFCLTAAALANPVAAKTAGTNSTTTRTSATQNDPIDLLKLPETFEARGIGTLITSPRRVLVAHGMESDGAWKIVGSTPAGVLKGGQTYLISIALKCLGAEDGSGPFLRFTDLQQSSLRQHFDFHAFKKENERHWFRVTLPSTWHVPVLHMGMAGKYSFEISSIQVSPLEAQPAAITLATDREVSLYMPGEPVYLNANFASSPRLAEGLNVIVIVRDHDGERVMEQRHLVKGNAGEGAVLKIGPVTPSKRGAYEAWIFDDAGHLATTGGFAVATRNAPWTQGEPDRVFFAIHEPKLARKERFSDAADLNKVAELLEYAGAGLVRFDLSWEEDVRGNINRLRLPVLLPILGQHNIEVLATVERTPDKWATPPIFPTREKVKAKAPSYNYDALITERWHLNTVVPSDMEANAQFLKDAVTHYGAYIRYWEIRNEPDWWDFWLSSCEDYLRLLDNSYHTIKAAAPDAVVMNGGLTMNGTVDPLFVDKLMTQGKAWFDVIAMHSYDTAYNEVAGTSLDQEEVEGLRPNTLSRLRHLQLSMEKHGLNHDVWINEGSAHVRPPREIAAMIGRKFVVYKSHHIRSWAYCRGGFGRKDSGIHALFEEWTPKLGYVAYSAGVSQLRNMAFDGKDPSQPDVVGYRFKGADGKTVSVFWKHGGDVRVPAWINLPTNTDLQAYDFLGNPVKIQSKQGKPGLDVTHEPVYIVFSAQQS